MAPNARSSRSLLVVGPNRPLFGWSLGVSAALAFAGVVLTATGVVGTDIQALLVGAPAGSAGGCIVMLCGGNRLAYDTRSRSLFVSGLKRRRPVFPRPEFDQIEYSIAENRIYAVRPDGQRQRTPYPGWVYDKSDWTALVERLPQAVERA